MKVTFNSIIVLKIKKKIKLTHLLLSDSFTYTMNYVKKKKNYLYIMNSML